jgi:hypothetical protein
MKQRESGHGNVLWRAIIKRTNLIILLFIQDIKTIFKQII